MDMERDSRTQPAYVAVRRGSRMRVILVGIGTVGSHDLK